MLRANSLGCDGNEEICGPYWYYPFESFSETDNMKCKIDVMCFRVIMMFYNVRLKYKSCTIIIVLCT